MISWFKKIWYGLGDLNDLELLILNTVRDKIVPEAVLLWDAQIADINKVQRLPDGVESDFYSIDLKTGKPFLNLEKAFPNQKKELLFAKVQLKHQESRIDIELWLVKGFLFSLEFRGSANNWLEYLGSDRNDDFRLDVQCEVVADLMKPA